MHSAHTTLAEAHTHTHTRHTPDTHQHTPYKRNRRKTRRKEKRDLSVEKLRILSLLPHVFGLCNTRGPLCACVCASVFDEQNFSRKAREEEGTAV